MSKCRLAGGAGGAAGVPRKWRYTLGGITIVIDIVIVIVAIIVWLMVLSKMHMKVKSFLQII